MGLEEKLKELETEKKELTKIPNWLKLLGGGFILYLFITIAFSKKEEPCLCAEILGIHSQGYNPSASSKYTEKQIDNCFGDYYNASSAMNACIDSKL